MDALTTVIKISERCNLSCDYCYYYQGNAKRWQDYPAYLSQEVADSIAGFLIRSAAQLQLKTLHLSLHGGEPMLAATAPINHLLAKVTKALNHQLDLRISLQTNATKLTTRWLELCRKYQVQLGVSIDGADANSNSRRISGNGTGAFPLIERGLQRLSDYNKITKNPAPHVLCVLASDIDAADFFNFCTKYQIAVVDFLLPDYTHDTMPIDLYGGIAYGHALLRLFKYWLQHYPKVPKVRIFTETLAKFLSPPQPPQLTSNNFICTIRSDGSLQLDDTYINIFSTKPPLNIKHRQIENLYYSDHATAIRQAPAKLAEQCLRCRWQAVCGGGAIIHRYQSKTGFSNPSVYCAGLSYFYQHVAPLTSIVREHYGITHS